jgi:hypothetical protein
MLFQFYAKLLALLTGRTSTLGTAHRHSDFYWAHKVCFLNTFTFSRVEAGSNTSTVVLRVAGGYQKGSLESETV